MGADLYIEKLEREGQSVGFELSKKAVDVGYFRDCYNSFGLFPFINMNSDLREQFSWWRFSDKKDWFRKTEDGSVMTISGAKKFLRLVGKAQKNIIKKKKLFRETVDHKRHASLSKGLPIDEALTLMMKFEKAKLITKLTNKEKTEMLDRLNLLIRFLRLAIKQKSTILWSV